MHTITREEITYTAKGLQDFANIGQQIPGEYVWKGIPRVLTQAEQNTALGRIL